jgi:hypothetical protein
LPLLVVGQRGTWSAWIKRSGLGTLQYIFSAQGIGTGTSAVVFNTDNTLEFYTFDGAYTARLTTTQVFRDVSAWYHVVAVFDTTSATATLTGSSTDRMRLYVNGAQVSNFSGTTPICLHSPIWIQGTCHNEPA